MIEVIALIYYPVRMEKDLRFTFKVDKELHSEVYEYLTKRLKKESRKVRLGEFFREAAREKLDREKKR